MKMMQSGDHLCVVGDNYIYSVTFLEYDEEGDLIVERDGKQFAVYPEDCFFLIAKNMVTYK
jgi:hypothetical protein